MGILDKIGFAAIIVLCFSIVTVAIAGIWGLLVLGKIAGSIGLIAFAAIISIYIIQRAAEIRDEKQKTK